VKVGALPAPAPVGAPGRMPRWQRLLIIIIIADIIFWLWMYWGR
jgi:hypothetical protein